MDTVHPLRRVVAALDAQSKAGTRFYVTIMPTRGDCLTYAQDNWEHMVPMTDALIEYGDVDGEVPNCVVVVRRFDGPPLPVGQIPPKTLAGFLLTGRRIMGLSAEQQRVSSETDNRTGMPLAPEPLVSYADAGDMLPEIKEYLEPWHPPVSRAERRRSASRRRPGRR